MNKFTSVVLLVAVNAVIVVAAIVAYVVITTDANPLNNSSGTAIIAFGVMMSGSVSVIIKMMMDLHADVNGRLTELLEATRAGAYAAGLESGRTEERAHPLSPPQEVMLVPDPEHPLPVHTVEKKP